MNPLIRWRSGVFIDSDIYAEFAWCYGSDGLYSYWGYRPDQMTFEEAAEKLLEQMRARGIEPRELPSGQQIPKTRLG